MVEEAHEFPSICDTMTRLVTSRGHVVIFPDFVRSGRKTSYRLVNSGFSI